MKSETNYAKKKQDRDVKSGMKKAKDEAANICTNASCRLRRAGCRGFEGCPGYKAK